MQTAAPETCTTEACAPGVDREPAAAVEPHIRVRLITDIRPALYAKVAAYRQARNQQANTHADIWSDADVLQAALIRGIESLDATTLHLLRKVPA